MQQNKELERTGTVVEALPNIMFRVELDSKEGDAEGEKEVILAYLAGKMRLHRIRVLVGDRVIMEMEPYGGKARIIKRL
jgi:translation initiation factor IF-1